MDLYGELHGYFLGIDPYCLSFYGVKDLQSVLVNGTGNNGENVEYLLWPDEFGRQACLKTIDGIFVMDWDITMDINLIHEYVFKQETENRKYMINK